MMAHSVQPLTLGLAVLAAAVSACSDTTRPAASPGQTVGLSFSGRAPVVIGGAMSAANALADTLVQVSGTDTLRITSVGIVLRKVELERASAAVLCDTITVDSPYCEDLALGPQLVNVPLLPGAATALSVAIDSGLYSSVQFEIHKPGSDSLDLLFKAAHPDYANVSIRVVGTFNGVAFTYTTALDQDQEYTFSPPLHVDGSGTATNLTIRFDLTTWFKDVGTGALIAPATALPGGANEGAVTQNIKNSIKAFEDRNHDGDERNG